MTATIYFAGGEDIDFIDGSYQQGLIGFSSLSFFHRGDWSRGGLVLSALSGGTSWPDNPGINQLVLLTPEWSNNPSDFWFHARAWIGGTHTKNNYNGFGFASPDGVWRLGFRGTGTDGQIKIDKRDSAGSTTTLATSAAGVLPVGNGVGPDSIDVHIVYGTSGSIDVYFNGSNTAALSYTGDTTTDAATSLNQAFFGAFYDAEEVVWSEVIISDSDTRSMGLRTLQPVAPGNTQDWSGSASDIAELEYDDTTYINSVSANQLSEWTCPTTLPVGAWFIQSVHQSARVNRGLAGPQHFEFVTRPATGSTDYTTTDIFPAAAFDNYHYQWATNPATSAAWIMADIATGFNLGIKSTS